MKNKILNVIVVTLLLFSTSASFAKNIEEFAKYIGDMTWKFDNGIIIKRDLELSISKRNNFYYIDVELDSVYVKNKTDSKTYYSDQLLPPYLGNCGVLSIGSILPVDGYQYITNGIKIYEYIDLGLESPTAMFPTRCSTDKAYNVTFEQNNHYKSDLKSIYWPYRLKVYLYNALIIVFWLLLFVALVVFVKKTYKPIGKFIRSIPKGIISSLAYAIGQFSEAYHSGKQRSLDKRSTHNKH